MITLLTDFSTKDGYVGAVKGVIKRINPQAEIVDVTHDIDSYDVLGAAFALNNFYKYFPKGTIHLAVVDPGVGSLREPILIRTKDFLFVGPDNGIFSFIYQREDITDIIIISNKKYFLAEPSGTFHARDIFAPVAAYLSLGIKIDEFGSPAKECVKFIISKPEAKGRSLKGEVIHIDRFGNLITNIPADLLENKRNAEIIVGKRKIKGISRSYFEIKETCSERSESKRLGALIGSSNFLELAVNQGSAQKLLKAKVGNPIRINFE
ncbi:MAG: SAM-dependent chlorinase/fluorinase [candidate division Zixibacteria bacterium]|nr:SAM-dependent chlorinase/fluorinase [candidate division Zixibacteria bacterium]